MSQTEDLVRLFQLNKANIINQVMTKLKRNKSFSSYKAKGVGYQVQADIMFLKSDTPVLVIIDVYSKAVELVVLDNKRSESVSKYVADFVESARTNDEVDNFVEYDDIIVKQEYQNRIDELRVNSLNEEEFLLGKSEIVKRLPRTIVVTDGGREFSKLKDYPFINHIVSKSIYKASLVERYIAIIKELLLRIMLYDPSLPDVDYIPAIEIIYNTTGKCSPLDILQYKCKPKSRKCKPDTQIHKLHTFVLAKNTEKVNAKLKLSEKASTMTNYHMEVFIIVSKYYFNCRYRYLVSDLEGNKIKYRFYYEDLKPIDNNIIEEIIQVFNEFNNRNI